MPQEFRDIGRFRLMNVVGRDAVGDIYRAEMIGTVDFIKHVSVKILRPELAQDLRNLRALFVEAEQAARLQDSKIVAVYEAGQKHGLSYLAVEHVHGWSLRQLIDLCRRGGRRFPVPAAAFVVSRLCAALRLLQSQATPIVHGAVAPEHVFVSRAGRVKLGDYCTAHLIRRSVSRAEDLPDELLPYLAPEQILGQASCGSSDVYAVGLILFELLTGCRLNSGDSREALLSAVASPADLVPSNIVDEVEPLDDACRVALQRDPEARSSADGLHSRLSIYLARQAFDAAAMAEFGAAAEHLSLKRTRAIEQSYNSPTPSVLAGARTAAVALASAQPAVGATSDGPLGERVSVPPPLPTGLGDSAEPLWAEPLEPEPLEPEPFSGPSGWVEVDTASLEDDHGSTDLDDDYGSVALDDDYGATELMRTPAVRPPRWPLVVALVPLLLALGLIAAHYAGFPLRSLLSSDAETISVTPEPVATAAHPVRPPVRPVASRPPRPNEGVVKRDLPSPAAAVAKAAVDARDEPRAPQSPTAATTGVKADSAPTPVQQKAAPALVGRPGSEVSPPGRSGNDVSPTNRPREAATQTSASRAGTESLGQVFRRKEARQLIRQARLRGLYPGDDPVFDRLRRSVRSAGVAGRDDMGQLRILVEDFVIDRAFVERKLARLHRAVQRASGQRAERLHDRYLTAQQLINDGALTQASSLVTSLLAR